MTLQESRDERALIALHDHATRRGATKTSVLIGVRKDGFTSDEIAKAADNYGKVKL